MYEIKNSIIDISHNYYNYLLNLERVVAVGLGYKWINGLNTFEPCINVLVKNKIDSKYLSSNNRVPTKYMGIKTDVIETGEFSFENEDETILKLRPLEGGCSVSVSDKKNMGTISCIVKKVNDLEGKHEIDYFILSNNHVIAGNNQYPIGSNIIQPSKLRGGLFPSDEIGHLFNFIPIKFIEGEDEPVNYVDCAIGKINNTSLISDKVFKIGEIKGIEKPNLNMSIQKMGARTGLTLGTIIALNITFYTKAENIKKTALFKDQILSQIVTNKGDSGSAIINSNKKIVGIHMSGTGDGFSLSNDINLVLEKLNVEVYKEE